MSRRYSTRFGRTLLSDLNVTPLIDLAFVLLIVFMITMPSLVEQSLTLNLPNARPQSATPPDPESVLRVEIGPDAILFVQGRPCSLPEFERLLADFAARKPDAAVALRADRDLRYQSLVSVFDVIKASGVRLSLATTPESP